LQKAEGERLLLNKSALIIVDMQNDFCPGGSLAVAGGDEIVPVINRYTEIFRERGSTIIASRDWHPAETGHFRKFGGLWPEHCVQGTFGAAFRSGLNLPPDIHVFSKGMDPEKDDYSALQARNEEGISMADFLMDEGISRLHICGLATDYCVLQTALEALRLGFNTKVLIDAVRGVDLNPGDSELAQDEMKSSGATLITINDLLEE
jgi:nicotinamidase/pyrazinamidase